MSSYPFERSAPNGLAHVRSLLYWLIFAKQSWWHFSCKRGKHICYVNMCSTAVESVVYTQTEHPLPSAEIVINGFSQSTSRLVQLPTKPAAYSYHRSAFILSKTHILDEKQNPLYLTDRTPLLSFSSNVFHTSKGGRMGLYCLGM